MQSIAETLPKISPKFQSILKSLVLDYKIKTTF